MKTKKTKTPRNERVLEFYQVLKSDTSIKHGLYERYKYRNCIETGFYKDNLKDSIWKIYNQQGTLTAKGKYKSGEKTGIWEFYSKNGQLVQKYNFDKDTLFFFDVNEERKFSMAPNIYPDTAQEQMPIFIGGISYMHALIENNIVYPKAAWDQNKSATVYVKLTIDKHGNTTDVKSMKPVGLGFDEAAINVVKSFSSNWISGKLLGKDVSVTYMIPIKFQLQ